MKVTTSRESAKNIKVLVYSQSGIGKTTLIATCPKPVIISSEKKLVSISGDEYPEFPVLEVSSRKDTKKAIKWIKKRRKEFESICVDSGSDIAEKFHKGYIKEGMIKRDQYGTLAEEMGEFLADLLEITDLNIYVIAKAKRFITAEGDEKFFPSMPGRVLPDNLPYMFDEVFALRIHKGEDEDEDYRYLQTQPTEEYEAKDSSGKLDKMEKPDLGYVFAKIAAPNKKKAKKKKANKDKK